MSLHHLGWTPLLQHHLAQLDRPDFLPARVVRPDRTRLLVRSERGEHAAHLSGRLKAWARREGPPTAGDWVAIARAESLDDWVAHHVLPRRGVLAREAPGSRGGRQVVAAHVDAVLLVMALGRDFNLARLERFLALAAEGGVRSLVVLNKLDACHDPAPWLAQARSVALGAPVLALSAKTGEGLPALEAFLEAGRTVALLGSSGVGKSTLLNRLVGQERMETAPVREGDGKGRHTTSARHLVPLPGGALLLDTPGLREVGLPAVDAGLSKAFEDVERLAAACRFSDCRHGDEPGCALRGAIEAGELDPRRLASHGKLRREAERAARKARASGHAEARAEDRRRGRAYRSVQEAKRSRRETW